MQVDLINGSPNRSFWLLYIHERSFKLILQVASIKPFHELLSYPFLCPVIHAYSFVSFVTSDSLFVCLASHTAVSYRCGVVAGGL